MKIFLSGPLFTAAEREFNRQLEALLKKAGHATWLPQNKKAKERAAIPVFVNIIEGIQAADVVVANMDGADPDSGTSWECGYAYASGMPIIVFRTDFRKQRNTKLGPYNLMMWASATERLDGPFSNVEELAEKLQPLLDKAALRRKQTAHQARLVSISAGNVRTQKL
jgi:nucleoside 2-deoxyribosyltransferase